MNIFKILSSGDGAIKEPNISAFLAYLIDPNKEHGLKDFLLKSMMNRLDITNDDKNIIDLQYENTIVDLTSDSRFNVNVDLEYKVKNNSKKDRFIDIVVKIFKNNNYENPYFILCIENKIRNESTTVNQLQEQLEGISKEYPNVPVGFIYLTPEQNKKSIGEYESFKNDHLTIKTAHLFWKDDIYNLLIGMLESESRGLIEPIFEYSKYTIKAFLNFINSDFQSYKEERKVARSKIDYKKPIREYIQSIYNNLLDDHEYELKDIEQKIMNLILEEANVKIVPSTLYAQARMCIVNEKNRLHQNINQKNHHEFDLFYYSDESKKKIKKFNGQKGIEVFINA